MGKSLGGTLIFELQIDFLFNDHGLKNVFECAPKVLQLRGEQKLARASGGERKM
jgi:hypothetical protein